MSISTSPVQVLRAVPRGSKRLRGFAIEREYLAGVTALPEFAQLRADARELTLEAIKQLGRRASYADGTTRRGADPWHVLIGCALSTRKRIWRRLQAWGVLGVVEQGCTPEFSSRLQENVAAIYVLCVPRARPAAAAPVISGPPTQSARTGVSPPAHARGEDQDGRASGAAQHGSAAAASAAAPADAVVRVLRRAARYPVSEGWCAWIGRPFAAAGWTAADLLWAIDHPPDDRGQHRLDARVRHPVGWLRWRLAQWLGQDGRPGPSASQIRAAARDRIRQQRAQLAELTGGLAAELALPATSEPPPAAPAVDPAPHAARIRARLGWQKQTHQKGKIMDFYDSVLPHLIPGTDHACLYYDGDFAAVPEDADRFAAVRWITVLGDFQHAGIADYERGNLVFSQSGMLRSWVTSRTALGKRARVYCDRANLPAVQAELEDLDWLLWLATLDGDKLSAGYAPNLWAVQYAGGPTAAYDTSILYGTW
jgi:hypothetical protein